MSFEKRSNKSHEGGGKHLPCGLGLIWMFHSRQLNQKINKIQERPLKITYKDTESTFSELLQKDSPVTIHTKNLQILMTEVHYDFGVQNEKWSEPFIFCRKSSVIIQLTTICVTITIFSNQE